MIKSNVLKIGTDCSGIEAPIEALKKICKNYNLSYKHIFSSEIDKYAIKYIKANRKAIKARLSRK